METLGRVARKMKSKSMVLREYTTAKWENQTEDRGKCQKLFKKKKTNLEKILQQYFMQ